MNKSCDMNTTLIIVVSRGQTPAARRVVAPQVTAPVAELKTIPCDCCHGTGRSMSEPRQCRTCGGRGWILGLPPQIPVKARPKAEAELTFSI